jgi:hypothetical protein
MREIDVKLQLLVRGYITINNLTMAEREGSKSFYNNGVIIDISENAPENTSRKLTLCLLRNGIEICSCASPKLFPTEKSQRPNG